MSMYACVECGKEISETAIRCPHCGYRPNPIYDGDELEKHLTAGNMAVQEYLMEITRKDIKAYEEWKKDHPEEYKEKCKIEEKQARKNAIEKAKENCNDRNISIAFVSFFIILYSLFKCSMQNPDETNFFICHPFWGSFFLSLAVFIFLKLLTEFYYWDHD